MRLVLDAMLGRLATYCRMAGHDTAYTLEGGVESDEAILSLAATEDRLLVTRDAALAAAGERSLLIESTDIEGQLGEILAVGIELSLTVPQRCSSCNGRLDRLETGPTPEDVPEPTDRSVWRCRDCGQHFWRGSHWDDVADRLESL